MTIKELFEKAENGVLTYEQFLQLAGDAKFADLSEGNYVSKQKYTDELSGKDSQINSLNDTIGLRDADLAKLQQQLEEAGTDATKLAEVTTQFADLKKQYDKDTKAYQKQLKEQAYQFAVKEFANKKQFSSNAAKRDFERSLLEKALPMEDGIILGAEDFVMKYSQNNEDAFVTQNQNVPKFVNPTKEPPKPSKKTLSELMAMKNEKPEVDINF